MRPILVIGGTGTLGRAVVRRLLAAGCEVRGFSRRLPQDAPTDPEWVTGDLRTGAGLEQAVHDVGAIIHCATDARVPRHDIEGTRTLIAAARAAGGAPLVYISIVGVDRVPLRYYGVKLEVERLVERSGLPWTILRTTQFHDLVLTATRVLARLPVMPVPARTSFQPIDARDVAARLVELALAPPGGRAPELGGPAVRTAADLARAYLRASGSRRRILPVRLPGKAARGYRHGGHLTPARAVGCRSYDDFLTEQAAAHAG